MTLFLKFLLISAISIQLAISREILRGTDMYRVYINLERLVSDFWWGNLLKRRHLKKRKRIGSIVLKHILGRIFEDWKLMELAQYRVM
jgi:hypothetical protein